MHWLLDNKEWVFSGIGVALLGWVLTLWRRRGSNSSAAISVDHGGHVIGPPVASGSNIVQTVNIGMEGGGRSPSSSEYSLSPNPVEIQSQLESLPIYQRNVAKDSYVGLKVRWPVTLVDLQELPQAVRKASDTGDTHTLIVKFGQAMHPIRTDLDIERFPRLKISHHGASMQLSGTISYVSDSGSVRLKDSIINFDEARVVAKPQIAGSADYRIGQDGTSIMIVSERATQRGQGPKPKRGWSIAFKSRYESAEFVQAGEIEGYTFEGKEFL